MATIQNARDVYLQAESPRLLPVTISNDFTFNGNVTGTLNSVPAATVTTGASNGTSAYSGTTNYRNDVAPTNAVPSASSPAVVNNNDGSRDITLTWTYTDGAVPADGFIIFYREGTGTVLSTDAGIQLPASARSFRFQGVHQGTAYRAGIAAFRRTEAGLRITSIYQPTSAPDWRVSATTVNITADINGVSASTLTSRATSGYDIQQKLEANGSIILTGQLVPTNTGALKAGTITWNSTTGALTGGTGIAVTEWGIIAASAGVVTFTIETSTGVATLKGDLITGGDVYAYGKNTATETYSIGGTAYNVDYSTLGKAESNTTSSVVRAGVVGHAKATVSKYNIGVLGYGIGATNGIGVTGVGGWFGGWFMADNTGAVGLKAKNTVSSYEVNLGGNGFALQVIGPMTINNTTLVTNLNSERWNGLKAIDSQVGSDSAFTNYLRVYDYGTGSYIYFPFKTSLP